MNCPGRRRGTDCGTRSAGARRHTVDPRGGLLDDDEVRKFDAFWRAANCLSVGRIYLLDNPLLTRHLAPKHIKPRLLGHWGTTPGLNFITHTSTGPSRSAI